MPACNSCETEKSKDQFAKSQLKKGTSKRCRTCTSSEQEQQQQQQQLQQQRQQQQQLQQQQPILKVKDTTNDATNDEESKNNDNQGVEVIKGEIEDVNDTDTSTGTSTGIDTSIGTVIDTHTIANTAVGEKANTVTCTTTDTSNNQETVVENEAVVAIQNETIDVDVDIDIDVDVDNTINTEEDKIEKVEEVINEEVIVDTSENTGPSTSTSASTSASANTVTSTSASTTNNQEAVATDDDDDNQKKVVVNNVINIEKEEEVQEKESSNNKTTVAETSIENEIDNETETETISASASASASNLESVNIEVRNKDTTSQEKEEQQQQNVEKELNINTTDVMIQNDEEVKEEVKEEETKVETNQQKEIIPNHNQQKHILNNNNNDSNSESITSSPTKSMTVAMTTTPTKSVEVNEQLQQPQVSSPSGRIRVGICAMDKKAQSKPMGEILARLDKEVFEIVQFGDYMITNTPVEQWPICDVLIAFYSAGYPLDKAERYAELHPHIFVLNDLKMQRVLMDRRRVYDLLEASGIDVPRHVFMNRDGYVSMTNTSDLISSSSNHLSDTMSLDSDGSSLMSDNDEQEHDDDDDVLVEHDDHIEVNGVVIHKPFVEKPVDADDHNIAIYYPCSAGGGCKKLFRKIGDRSSEFYPHINEVRRDGSFIYEEYVETQGIDVKMYTVGPDYGHAEARKSPTVDGKVERNADGKEVRFPVILTLREKEIARRIVMVFKQQVCGFDLLRVQEGDSLVSYVCDVNGWSFVKKSKKYYEDCAQILTEHMLAAVKPVLLHGFSALDPLLTKVKDAVVDSTPKRRRHHKTFSRSKSDAKVIGSPDKNDDANSTATLENSAFTLAEGAAPVRQIPDLLMDDPTSSSVVGTKGDEDSITSKSTDTKQITQTHQEELRCVITVVRHGDRTPKQKLKVKMSEPLLLQYFHDHTDNCKKELKVKDKIPMTAFLETVRKMIAEKQEEEKYEKNNRCMKKNEIYHKMLHVRDVLERWKIGGLNRKLQMKPTKWDEYINTDGMKILKCTQLQLILKWGGNLTKLGEKQAINLGIRLRQDVYPDETGGGILRLHSTFRHDLKIITSDEGRVMKTAAAFAKGLLELEGPIPPILVSLVHKERGSHHMLDPSGNKEVKKELDACKVEVNKNLQKDFKMEHANPEMIEKIIGPPSLKSLHNALRQVGNPRKTLFTIHSVIKELLDQLDDMLGGITSDMENKNEGGEGLIGDEENETLSGIKLYKGETLLELTERWRLLYTKSYDEDEDEFDLSRVPDVHDNVRFDMLHNPHLGLTSTLEKLYTLAKLMADCVVLQEYGTSIEQKRGIGNKTCKALLEKLLYDLIIAQTDNQVDMRYMINLQYAADLPINTMGRRIHTRLYFTSESHLHTLLNVLRFASSDHSSTSTNPLSPKGIEIVSNAPELCYLTQIVIGLLENTSKEVDNPKRFRIEIFFSPGATATPLHMPEYEKDADTSRFDTEPYQLISKAYLTCKELEEYFSEAIKEGKTEDDEDDNAALSVVDHQSYDTKEIKVKEETLILPKEVEVSINDNENNSNDKGGERIKFVTISEEKNTHIPFADDSAHSTLGEEHPSNIDESNRNGSPPKNESTSQQSIDESTIEKTALITKDNTEEVEYNQDEDDKVKEMALVLGRQYFWTSVTAVSFVLGIGCIILSREIVQNDFKTRRWSRR